jgi:cell wall-associated NlpC family hydrolase
MTPSQRQAVCAEARSWLRTPYHEHGRVKHAGADCALFPLDVYTHVLGLTAPPIPRYQMQWHLHRTGEKYLEYVRTLPGVQQITETQAQPGDFVLYRLGRVYSHGAIILDWPHIVHAINPRGVVLDDAHFNETLRREAITKPLFFTF